MDAQFVEIQTALAGRYSLERELGRGGMGIVYLAHEVALDRPVALKFLPPELTAEDGVRERFLREARTAAKLSHPHIVPIYTVGEADDYVFFAMAAINGETLGERVRNKGPLSNSEAMRLLKEVSWALAYAHAQGVVHRDIKPDNILLEEGSGRALVTDFGIAEAGAAAEAGAPGGIAEAGGVGGSEALGERGPSEGVSRILGTAEFMSPEQARGVTVDGRSDLYSLAAVGFFAVSGRAPFEGPSASAVMGRHLSEPPPRLAEVVPSVSPVIAGVVDRCLRKDPERRFLGGESVADALSQEAVLERQLPVPVRVFIKNLRRLTQTTSSLTIVSLFFLVPLLIGIIVETGAPLGVGLVFGVLAALVGAVGGSVAWQARKVARAGFTLEEIRLALLEDVNRRNEEIRFEVGPRKTAVDRILNWAVGGSLGVALAAVMAMLILGLDTTFLTFLGRIFGFGMVGGLAAGWLRTYRAYRRADIIGERWLRLWSGKIGEWLFGLGSLGLDPPVATPVGMHRSTEVALGLAAVRLFEELPRESRRELGDLPETVRRLEADARTLRAEVKALNVVLGELENEPGTSLAVSRPSGHGEARETVRRDVEATRDEAEERLRDVVAALETIRVGLLRMHAGESIVHSVTMDLEAARSLSGDLESLLEGHREVERLLTRRRATGSITEHGPTAL